MVVSFVGASTEGADDGAFANGAAGNGVVEGVAAVAASEDGECGEFFDGGGSAEKGGWVPDELGKL